MLIDCAQFSPNVPSHASSLCLAANLFFSAIQKSKYRMIILFVTLSSRSILYATCWSPLSTFCDNVICVRHQKNVFLTVTSLVVLYLKPFIVSCAQKRSSSNTCSSYVSAYTVKMVCQVLSCKIVIW